MGGRTAVFACFLVSLACLAGLFTIIRGSELPQLKVTASPAVAFAPSDVIVTVLAKPDERNRYLSIGIGATDSLYASSSQKQVHGLDERGELARITYPKVPPGNYLIVAALFDRDGVLLARQTATVRRISRVE